MPLYRVLGLFLLFVSPLAAQNPVLERIITRGRHPAIRWGVLTDVQADAKALYQENGWEPLWLARGRPTAAGEAVLDALTTAGDRGLSPEDYDASQLVALAATLRRGGADAEQAGRFDAALTVAALRFVTALARGRVGPAAAQARFDAATSVRALRGTLQPGPILQGLEPSWPQYTALKRALTRYRSLWRDSAARLPRPAPMGAQPGQRYPGALRLRRLLEALGDLPARPGTSLADDSSFTPELSEGIRRFQLRQGAHVDGRLDETTWRLLQSHLPLRIRQIQLALERWRWLGSDVSGTPLLISIPAMRLSYFIAPGDPELNPLRMSVRIGRELSTLPAVWSDRLSGIVLHPNWDRHALGDVRFVLEGRAGGVYLHGSTPDAGSWERAGAENAAGSVHLADARLLAELLLRYAAGVSPARVRQLVESNDSVSVALRRGVPVLLVYQTAVARENGQVYFYGDRLGFDRRLEQQLARGYPFVR